MAVVDSHAVESMLKGIDRYNPENLSLLEPYVRRQITENFYDKSANLSVLKLYQFNPAFYQQEVVTGILLKALTALPEPDFSLCECLIDQHHHEDVHVGRLIFLHHLLETCDFRMFWREVQATPDLIAGMIGFEEAIKKYICYAVSISYQHISRTDLKALLGEPSDEELQGWIKMFNWTCKDNGLVFVTNQEEIVKTRNIVDKVNFEKVQSVMKSGLTA
uniref:Eukaryotic translation initiation factor 3 subunit K n=1 Tax=Phallusia mammillata TaxID=59560 RepID=A0A6F9DBN5_9ASCI|nr:eukaryotic translation initiation factor 3 subunit K-like [Phallusia mammillata]